MKIIEASATLAEPINITDEKAVLKRIEECGRIAYQSGDKATDESARGFVRSLIARGHESVLEHIDYIVLCDRSCYIETQVLILQLRERGTQILLRSTEDRKTNRCIISGNIRMWRDLMRAITSHNLTRIPAIFRLFKGVLFEDVIIGAEQSDCECRFIQKDELLPGDETMTHWTETAFFVTDRGVSHEIVRHRPASYTQESTRYCNYANGKFGSELTFIEPHFWDDLPNARNTWCEAMVDAEARYMDLLEAGATPQEARSILPSSLKTQIAMTTNASEWRHFFRLRCAPEAHPQMREVAFMLLKELHERVPVLFDDIWEEFV